jgi:anthraniloyl-CoA monooxygenase
MRIAVCGGGPGGLYSAILLRKLGHDVDVWERNAADDTFGFGVVFSDETMSAFEVSDPTSFARIVERFAHWSDIDVHYRGATLRSGGHGFSALSRKVLLGLLQERAVELGAAVRFSQEHPPIERLSAEYDLVIACDGVNSAVRAAREQAFGTTLDPRRSRYMWLATDLVFDAFTFHVLETEHGVLQVHGYPFDDRSSTFIVETDERTWRAEGLDAAEHADLPPGVSDEASIERCRELFAPMLEGHSLFGNNSKWLRFTTVRNARWHDGNVVLLGDAAHTAHFSIGSGTKLAMEDAIALAWAVHDHGEDGVDAALAAYEADRRPVVESTQRAAQASLEWFEEIARYVGQPPRQFAFNLLTRSRRITYDNLRVRDESFVDGCDHELVGDDAPGSTNGGRPEPAPHRPPMFLPYRLRDLRLENRVVVSPMDMYSAVDGTIGDFHLVHLGSRGIGGAGLVMSEMICVSEQGRITPGCAGLYRDDQVEGWRRVVDFVHGHGRARIGAQIGHSGRKGSTKLLWEGSDEPLDGDNWEVVAPSPIPWAARNQTPVEIDRAGMDRVRDEFVAATRRAAEAGFDLLEVHLAHGYLLSSFLSPLTNRRTDEYGGDLAARARFPLEVVDACRAAWPADRPLSVRISATDWAPGGFTGDDAVELSALLQRHEVDIVHVSTGQVWAEQRPAYGRSYQTPFADRIRHEVGIPTIAVGAISSAEDVNTTILAGRADLCALGRPHLYDPYWTLHAQAQQGYRGDPWIPQYRSGRRPPNDGTLAAKTMPRSFDEAAVAHGWRPVAASGASRPGGAQ